jgi:hypothetical protein
MDRDVIVGLLMLGLVAVVGAIAGALATAVFSLLVAGGAHLIGFITAPTAQAVALWLISGGAILGAVKACFFALAAGAIMG